MSVEIRGMDEWLQVLRTLPERAPQKFKPMMLKAGLNIKDDWTAQWRDMPHAHIPHLIRNIGADNPTVKQDVYSVVVGVAPGRLQSRLASFIEYGTLTSRPHPAGEPALQREAPRMAEFAEQIAEDLLTGAA